MTGTFATLTEVDVHWDEVSDPFFGVLIEEGSDTLLSYAIRRQTQNGSTISVEIKLCGGTSTDVCSPALNGGEAYGDFVPETVWDHANMPLVTTSMTVTDPDPGDPYVGNLEAVLLGLDLTTGDFASWPSSRSSSSIVWLDHDGDDGDFDGSPFANLTPTPLATTTYVRTSGTSMRCGMDYAALPIPNTFPIVRASHIMTGSRAQSSLEGEVVSCDVMGGRLGGPSTCHGTTNTSDMPCFDGRARNCVRYTGSATGAACSSTQINELDATFNDVSQEVTGARFVMERVDDDFTCEEARNHDYPTIPD
jgi:hypothetical protein